MIRKQRVGITVVLIMLISVIILTTGAQYYQRERSDGLDALQSFAHLEAEEIQKFVESDLRYLEKVASLVGMEKLEKIETLAQRLTTMGSVGMLERVDVLLPEGRLITATGDVLNVENQIDYEAIIEEEIRISRRMKDPMDETREIVQYYAPVWMDGEAVVIACGCVNLNSFPKYFRSAAYGDALQFCIVEKDSADILMDTWIEVMSKWAVEEERYSSLEKAREGMIVSEIQQWKGMVEIYVEPLQEYYYCHYEPIGVSNWLIALAAPESVILSQALEVQERFYAIGFMLLVIMVFYLLWIMWDARREILHSESQIKNIQYLQDVEHELFSSYAQPERIDNALQKVCEYTTAEKVFFWILEEGVVGDRRLWCSSPLTILEFASDPAKLFPKSFAQLLGPGKLLSYDLEPVYGDYADEKKTIQTGAIYSLMAIVVKDLHGKKLGLLGAYNMKKKWASTEPLDQVALSFAVSIGNYFTYRELARMGQVDELTELLNRNSYHVALLDFVREDCNTFACIYIDANGLHEVNNHLGHKAGDMMLCSVADVLKKNFAQSNVYRVGGDEFVVLSRNQSKEELEQSILRTQQMMEENDYSISVGMAWQDTEQVDITAAVDVAEAEMQRAKRQHYEAGGGERQMRNLEQRMNQLLTEKHDTDVFLQTLDLGVEGIYFVDLNKDTCRTIRNPEEFEQILAQENGRFAGSIMSYVKKRVHLDYLPLFGRICDEDYRFLKRHFQNKEDFEFSFLCNDGEWLKLRITKTQSAQEGAVESMWVFGKR